MAEFLETMKQRNNSQSANQSVSQSVSQSISQSQQENNIHYSAFDTRKNQLKTKFKIPKQHRERNTNNSINTKITH